jgi:subtilisin family serine protease
MPNIGVPQHQQQCGGERKVRVKRTRRAGVRLTAGWTLATVAAAVAALAAAPPASAVAGVVLHAGGADAVPNSYIVVLKGKATKSPSLDIGGLASGLISQVGGSLGQTFQVALHGFTATMSTQQARQLAANPAVAFVEQNHYVHIAEVQSAVPSWGLDRIDQSDLPLDGSYSYTTTAANVNAYIIDTGIRFTHQTFGSRAHTGFDAVTANGTAEDCHGHGTHVAGTVGGAEYGVAKAVELYAVRVLNCQGSGTTAQVVAGVDWVTQHAVAPAVANMSLGGSVSNAIDQAVSSSIASGVTYAVAAGNGNFLGLASDACTVSPARVPEAITVSATNNTDTKASWANTGSCVKIFAPGVGITSSWASSDTATNTISGTSMATPHVTGAAALYLADHPTAAPAEVQAALVDSATPGHVTNAGWGSPNRLLYTGP